MQKSVWEEYENRKEYDILRGQVKCDVLVIGGGLAGLLCLYKLRKEGVNALLAEKGRIGRGVTRNTTAKITSQHSLVYSDLISMHGIERAKGYLLANEEAISQYRKLSEEIDCDFSECESAVYTLTSKEKILREAEALNTLGYKAKYRDRLDIPEEVIGAIAFKGQAKFNPEKFISAISLNMPIYENTKIIGIDKGCAYYDGGKIYADKIIVATHFPFLNKHGAYFLKMYQAHSYVLALSGADKVDGIYIDEREGGHSYRSYKDLLLLGGNSHRTGKKSGGFSSLMRFASEAYKGSSVKYKFATEDCITLDKIPYIGRYSPLTDGLYVCTGFNKWGMTGSMVGATILTDELLENKNDYAEVFSPRRTVFRKKLFVNILESTANLLRIKSPRCTHLGCALQWNKEEHTFDCPCHGSRYLRNGEVINGPAIKNLKKQENEKKR